MSDNESESRETVADETKTCPLCGGRVFWFPVSNYWGCEHCKNTFNRYTVFPDEVKKTSAVGNAAAMRDIVTALANVVLPPRGKADEDGWLAWVRAMQAKARAALADATTEKSSAVGNAAAMREALVFLRDQELWMLEGNVRHCVGLTVFGLEQACKIMRGVIEDALSAPPRQCDVGTPEEQRERFKAFCRDRQYGLCDDCPIPKKGFCTLQWAQMPYKAEEGEDNGVQSAS